MRIHLAFPTAHFADSVAFYTVLFGVGPDKTREGFARFAPPQIPVSLSLSAADGVHIPDDSTHFGLRVDDAAIVEAAIARLSAAGRVEQIETNEVCCHAAQTKVWTADPDGRDWEVYVILDDAPADDTSASSCCPTPEPVVASSCCAPKTSCCGS